MSIVLKRTLFFLSLIGLWQLIVSLEIWPPSMVPSPGAVFQELFQGFKSFSLVHDILASFKHLIIGLSISLIIGIFFGFMLATFKTFDETVGSLVLALQSVPSIVWVPLAIIWFGFNEKAIIFVVVIGGTFVMIMNIRTGVKNVEPLLIQAARTMGSKNLHLFFHIILPASVPYAITGVRLAWAFSWRALMAAELLSTGPGLGFTLSYASDFNNMSLVIGIIIIIGSIGALIDQLVFQKLEKNILRRWGLDTN